MVYTHRHPAALSMGPIFLLIVLAMGSDVLNSLISGLHGKEYAGEMVRLGCIFGVAGIVFGVWQLWGAHGEGGRRAFRPAGGTACQLARRGADGCKARTAPDLARDRICPSPIISKA